MSVDQPTLVDVPLRPAGICEACGRPLRPAATGRPGRFCSSTCRSAAHRRRAKAEPRTPQAAAPAVLAGVRPGRRAELLEGAEAVTAATVALADVLDQGEDPDRTAAALQALLAAAAELTHRATRAAGATKPGPADGGQPALPEPRGDAFRGGNETPPNPDGPAAPAFRGGNETPPAAEPVTAPARPAPARPARAVVVAHPDDTGLQPDAVLRAASDPVRRFGAPDRTDDLALTFGPGWSTTSWSAREAAGVHQFHHHGVRVGWAALLGDGPWGPGGWIAVLHLADGRTEPLIGDRGRPRVHPGWSEALDALRSTRRVPPATAARTPDADRPRPSTGGWLGPRAAEPAAGTVRVPRDPLRRGLPRSMDLHIPLDPAVFGYAWELAGWTVQPDVLVVLGEGYPVGWVERGLDGGDGRVAVYENHFLGDPKTQQAALHDTPELAAHSILRAHVHDL
ncbi:hypothetical protein K353_05837 [Kitasatospora sp. SolWspMP-SS2h]|uniref:hypothetical protein n=1 Tax=Kitasatospora sp. SolWspMP-SS2h TaxID=1305729 RepID=UPI000DC02E21|nr:hypothetical protein [Kitasatospora sp. SolWspMP-SS2h]RAJ32839.1 hypothetical protein K353_05837 [Kitasatospora sp. SolWspMP-SS2h]